MTISAMRFVVSLSASVLVCALVCAHDYSDINTEFNFESLEKDPAAFKKQMDCYMDRAPCDPLPEHYKRHISEGLQDDCQECSDKLKHNIKVFLKELKSFFPEDYTAFRNKYDPDGIKFDTLANDVQKY